MSHEKKPICTVVSVGYYKIRPLQLDLTWRILTILVRSISW